MGVDVVVVGASIAGCTAARLFADAGARVALVERKPDPDAYKVVCTHQVLASGVPTIERLGLADALAARGAVRTRPAFWTPDGGWGSAPPDSPAGYGVTRRTLDPLLRRHAADAGVELLLGHAVVRVLEEGGRVSGVETATPSGETRRLRATLVVGADGRTSPLARLARMPGRVRRNNRFFYFAYWRGLTLPSRTAARLWLLDPAIAASFPNEDDLTVVVVARLKSELDSFRADPEASYRARVASLPDGPDLATGERASKLIGIFDVPNVVRPAIRPGLALAGDAAITVDPVFGTGCSWALQSAEWLVDATADAVLGGGDLDRALRRYRRKLFRRILPHYLQIADFATGRRLRADERRFLTVAAKDPVAARALDDVATRRSSPLRALDPRLVPPLLRG